MNNQEKGFIDYYNKNFINAGIAANIIYRLTLEIDKEGVFCRDFIKFVIKSIQNDYSSSLAPFYENAFDILEPSPFEKTAIIQSFKNRNHIGFIYIIFCWF